MLYPTREWGRQLENRSRKEAQRERAKRGSRVLLGLEIIDWDAWLEILRVDGLLHGADTLGAVRVATERYVWEECRAYRREQAQERRFKRPRPDNANPVIYESIRAKQQTEADGLNQGDWYDEADVDDGMDPMLANSLVEEGGYQVEED
jgi:hypothetical protein